MILASPACPTPKHCSPPTQNPMGSWGLGGALTQDSSNLPMWPSGQNNCPPLDSLREAPPSVGSTYLPQWEEPEKQPKDQQLTVSYLVLTLLQTPLLIHDLSSKTDEMACWKPARALPDLESALGQRHFHTLTINMYTLAQTCLTSPWAGAKQHTGCKP